MIDLGCTFTIILSLSLSLSLIPLTLTLTFTFEGDAASEDDHRMRTRRRGLLRMYYGVDDQVPEEKADPLDIDHVQFKSDMFMEKVLKECSLNELYHMEGKMKKGVLLIVV